MGLNYNEIDDAVLLTQDNLIKKGAFVDMQTDLTDHVAVRTLWKNRQKKFDGGNDWTFDCQIDHNHSATAVGLYESDGDAMIDTMIEGKTGPRHVNAHYAYDKRHPAFQRGGTSIVDFVNTKYVAMMVSFYEYLESVLWGCPDAADTKTPFGISYWVTKGTNGQEGFYGLDPTGYTATGRASITSSSQTRWRNYFADYDEVSSEDLVRKIDRGMMATQFRSVVDHSQPDLGAGKSGVYANLNTSLLLKSVLEKRNMNLGNDLIGNVPLLKGNQVEYVPTLDADTSNPVYVLDWRWLAIGVLSGWENNLTAPYMVPGKHLVSRVDLDATLNMVCTNLRKQMVFATV